MNSLIINTLSIATMLLSLSCAHDNHADHAHHHGHDHTCAVHQGEDKNGLNALEAPGEFENIHIEKLYSDSLATSFVIWVKDSVASHKHLQHTENIYVLEGEAKMTLGKDTLIIKKGDLLFVPKNTFHSVLSVNSQKALKVLSVQSPEFNGTDRIFEY